MNEKVKYLVEEFLKYYEADTLFEIIGNYVIQDNKDHYEIINKCGYLNNEPSGNTH